MLPPALRTRLRIHHHASATAGRVRAPNCSIPGEIFFTLGAALHEMSHNIFLHSYLQAYAVSRVGTERAILVGVTAIGELNAEEYAEIVTGERSGPDLAGSSCGRRGRSGSGPDSAEEHHVLRHFKVDLWPVDHWPAELSGFWSGRRGSNP